MNPPLIVSFGELLWDLLPSGPVLGGAPCNFAYRMHALGHRSLLISRVGEGSYGDWALEELRSLGMGLDYIQMDHTHPTGTVEVSYDAAGQPVYDIVPDVAYDYIEVTDGALAAVEEAKAFCFGTLIQRNPISRASLHTLLGRCGVETLKVYDINLRPEGYSQEHVEGSLKQADVLKLNEHELRLLAGWFDLPEQDLVASAQALVARWDLRLCLVTLGERGALGVEVGGHCHYEPGFEVEMVEPTGAGDAFTAGFLHEWLEHRSLAKACRMGCALGALVATQSGATDEVAQGVLEAFLAFPPGRKVESTLARWGGQSSP